jgi:hypothetical protein
LVPHLVINHLKTNKCLFFHTYFYVIFQCNFEEALLKLPDMYGGGGRDRATWTGSQQDFQITCKERKTKLNWCRGLSERQTAPNSGTWWEGKKGVRSFLQRKSGRQKRNIILLWHVSMEARALTQQVFCHTSYSEEVQFGM